MAVKLNVRFVTQSSIGGHVQGAIPRNDPTGCWYASACMVGYYFEQGPRLGLPELYKLYGHDAIRQDQIPQLAKNENLEQVAQSNSSHNYTLDELEELLRTRGPILFFWEKDSGGQHYGHVSVIIGTEGAGLIFHDPEDKPNSRMTIVEFNRRREKFENALMQRRSMGRVAARVRMFER